jgi:serine/threonine protein phosphatase PrpC
VRTRTPPLRGAMTTTATWGALTHRGTVRSHNQDAFVANYPIFAVADGMGGHAAGDIASQIAVEHVGAFAGAAGVDAESMVAACHAANAEIRQRARAEHLLEGMGTTIAGLAFSRGPDGDGVLVFNAGDSRVYLSAGGVLAQISEDHSVVAEMVAAKELSEADARRHPQRNVVTRALGVADEIEVDTWLIPTPEQGHRFLICSDGLTNEIEDAELAHLLKHTVDPDACARLLLDLALKRGARDNVTVIVVDVRRQQAFIDAGSMDADTMPRLSDVAPAPRPASDEHALIHEVPDFGTPAAPLQKTP